MASVTTLLQSWNIPDEIINNFVQNDITIEHLPKLKPDNLKELCPHMATRLHLQDKLEELVTAHAPTESNSSVSHSQVIGDSSTICDQTSDCTNSTSLIISLDSIQVIDPNNPSKSFPNFTPRKSFPNFDLETLLQTSAGGNSILKYYETYGFLDNTKRSQLVDIIIKHIYTHIVNCRITYEEYNLIGAKIVSLFPKESIGTYFTKPIRLTSLNGRSTIARGKLVDKVRNLLYKYGDRKRPSTSAELESTLPPKKHVEDLQNLHSRDIIFLNNNNEPWDEVLQKWKNTFNLRKESEYENVHEFIKEWKILYDQRSEALINIDFDILYPEKGLNFYLNWNSFFKKLISLKPPRVESTKNLVESLETLEDDLKLPTQIKILAHLVPPKGRLSKKIKFTTQEAIDSLYICVQNIGDIDQVITEQKQKASSKKLSVQPYIILQGSLQACMSPLLIVDDSCKRTYDKKNRFKNHLTMCYNSNRIRDNSSYDNGNNSSNFISLDCSSFPSTDDTYKPCDTSPSNNIDSENESYLRSIKSFLNIFVCKLYEFIGLPRSLIQTFIEMVHNLINDITSKIYETIKNEHVDATERINVVQNMILALPDIFKNYDTEFKRLKHLGDQKYYVAPVEVTIGSSKDRYIKNNNVTMLLKERKLYMSPLRLTLKNFLHLPGVLSDILNYQQMLSDECDVIRNVIQGSLWKEITANIAKDDIVIPLILYFDDFESGNALGSHAGDYKLGAVYISIGTIPPDKSSRLENIFVGQVFYSNDRVYFGNEATFNKIIEELKFLEEVGINIAFKTKNVTVKFILVTLSGDNLGLHGILGLFESFMATNFCRFCLTTKTESETQLCELNNLRIPSEYDRHVENRVGIKENCVWNSLKYFHIYKNQTCDLMHDLTEGVHRYGMAVVIQSLIDKKYFSLDRLNSRIKYFKYNTSEKNIPPSIHNQHLLNRSLTMSASEMLCLVRNFVFIVGDLVKDKDPVWDYYLILLEITNILTSHSFTLDLIDYLKYIIEEHHQQYLNLFPSKLKPKHHFLIHYPTIIKKIGPPILISAFKYEAKHKELKKVCQSITSRKDLPLSVMKRCQLNQSFRYATDKGLNDNLLYGKFEFDDDNPENDNCIHVDWCELNGIKYMVDNVLLQGVNDDIPKYYIINKIVINHYTNDILFKCFFLDIVNYSAHFKAYQVIQTTHSCNIAYRDLYTNLTSVVYKVNSDSYVKVEF